MIKYINYINKKHKRGGFFKGICLFLFCIMLTICSLPLETLAKNSDKASVMRIEEAVGTVKINASNASSGMQLYSGDTVSTESASYSHISLDASKLIKLSQKSQASISKSGKKLEIALVSGEMFFDVKKKLSGDESMTMKSSSVSMSVRGTSGIIRNYGDSIRVSLYDGILDVVCPSGSFSMWGGESVVFNSDGTIQHRDLVDVKRMSEFEDQVIATDGDVINRASANMNVGLPVARYNARSAGQNIEENIQQIVVPVVEPKPVEQPAQPVIPKPEKKKNVTPPASSSSSHSSDHHDSSDDSHDDDHSGGGSDGGDDPKPDPEPTPDPTPDPEPTCEHNWEYQNKVENHIKTCTKCGQTETENHTPTYSKMELYPELHLETCSLCGYDNGVEHTFNIEGHFDKNGQTTEDTNEYYTRKCICDTVDLSSKGGSCDHIWRYDTGVEQHYKLCTECGESGYEKHMITYTYTSATWHIEYCNLCKYQSNEIGHTFSKEGYFDKFGNTTENRQEYYTRKCKCNTVDPDSKVNVDPTTCEHNWVYQDDGENHLKTCSICNVSETEPHELEYSLSEISNDLHVETCKKCGYSRAANHEYEILGMFNENGQEISDAQEYYTNKCDCGRVDPSSKKNKDGSPSTFSLMSLSNAAPDTTTATQYNTYSVIDSIFHKCTKLNGAFIEEEHEFVDKYNQDTEKHRYCRVCGYEIFEHSYVSGQYLMDGSETDDIEAACYSRKCSVPQCGALKSFDYENYPGTKCDGNHNFIYVKADTKTCDRVCNVCHYLDDSFVHVPVIGVYNKVTLSNGEQYYTKKCSNCGYLYPESIVRKIKS